MYHEMAWVIYFQLFVFSADEHSKLLVGRNIWIDKTQGKIICVHRTLQNKAYVSCSKEGEHRNIPWYACTNYTIYASTERLYVFIFVIYYFICIIEFNYLMMTLFICPF